VVARQCYHHQGGSQGLSARRAGLSRGPLARLGHSDKFRNYCTGWVHTNYGEQLLVDVIVVAARTAMEEVCGGDRGLALATLLAQVGGHGVQTRPPTGLCTATVRIQQRLFVVAVFRIRGAVVVTARLITCKTCIKSVQTSKIHHLFVDKIINIPMHKLAPLKQQFNTVKVNYALLNNLNST
jgi:hypothetical protein